MEKEIVKKCPFGELQCDEGCSLYVSPGELNELVLNRLSSLGVLKKNTGNCSLRIMAMSQARYIFENTSVYKN